ncbi:MAG: hypothetical protein CM15mV142_320 [Caudoviricetes sp.]|nr:MAG: hypothetical protein CM15mV142_320 [Caudoviricetes sp.]
MPYLGQRPSKGDENNFKILDNISSYTLTFDGSDGLWFLLRMIR